MTGERARQRTSIGLMRTKDSNSGTVNDFVEWGRVDKNVKGGIGDTYLRNGMEWIGKDGERERKLWGGGGQKCIDDAEEEV